MQVYRRFSDLKKFHLQALDGEIGKPDEFYFDDQSWTVRYFVVQTGNWLFGREVLIAPGMLSGVDDRKKTVGVELTREQVENSPEVETVKPVSRYYEEQYHLYYGWQPYWASDLLSTPEVRPAFYPIPDDEKKTQKPPDIHLRSSRAVTGYTILAVDGEIGTMKDFILGDEEWGIRYLEVDVGSWLRGRKVVVSPAWIKDVDWLRNEVSVKLSRESIQSAPEYDPAAFITKEYELEVFKHYSASLGNLQEDKK